MKYSQNDMVIITAPIVSLGDANLKGEICKVISCGPVMTMIHIELPSGNIHGFAVSTSDLLNHSCLYSPAAELLYCA
jgi:hypothetical protein